MSAKMHVGIKVPTTSAKVVAQYGDAPSVITDVDKMKLATCDGVVEQYGGATSAIMHLVKINPRHMQELSRK